MHDNLDAALMELKGKTPDQIHALMVERGVKTITGAGKIAGCSCPDNLVPKFLGLGVQYFHSNVGSLLQSAGETYLKTMRKSAA